MKDIRQSIFDSLGRLLALLLLLLWALRNKGSVLYGGRSRPKKPLATPTRQSVDRAHPHMWKITLAYNLHCEHNNNIENNKLLLSSLLLFYPSFYSQVIIGGDDDDDDA